MAAIPAQNLVNLEFAPHLSIMDKMTRPALVLSLKAYGETPPESWTKVELMGRLRELADSGEIDPPTAGKQKTPLETAVSELNRAAAKKSVLQAHVQNMGVKITGNETIAGLQEKAMKYLVQSVDVVGKDKMGFGKYASQTYEHVKRTDSQYCQWVRTTAKEGGCSMYLSRFATWLESEDRKPAVLMKEKVDMNEYKDVKKTPGAKIKEMKVPPASSTTSSPELKEESSASSGSMEQTVHQLTHMVATLTQEVQTLKSEKGEKPRKMVARADTEMGQDQDGS